MFTKGNITQSILDAVNSVLNEKKMSEADLDETGLRKAAYAAHTAGQKMFSFKGKTYPVRVQGEDISYGEAVEESVEIEEAASGIVTKTQTGLVHRSTKAYGGSKPEKDPLDKLKGPKTKELVKKDVQDYEKTRGRYDEELKGDQHKIDKNKNKKIDAHDFAILRGEKKVKEEYTFKDKLIESIRRSDIPASVRKARGDAPLTPAEVKGPSKDAISAPQNLAKARNEEVEQIEEIKKPTGELKDACWKGYTAVGMKMKGGRKVPNCVPEEVELDEASCEDEVKKHEKKMHGKEGEVAKHVEKMHKEDVGLNEKAGYSAKAARAGKDIGKPGKMFAKIAAKAGERYGSKERGEKVAGAVLAKLRKEEEEFTDEEVDAILEAFDLEERAMTDAEMKKREDIVKGMKKGLAGFKQRYGARAKDVMYATATKQAMKEESIEEDIDAPLTTDTLAGRVAGGKANSFKSYKVRLKPLDKEEQDMKTPELDVPELSPGEKTLKAEATIAGTAGWKKTEKDVKDKSGAVHTPMSRARDLAQKAFKRVQDKTKIKK
jgi:hypothetical protein